MPLPLRTPAQPETPRPDRESLIAALAARQLDRTLTTSLAPIDPADETAIGATNIRQKVEACFGRRFQKRTGIDEGLTRHDHRRLAEGDDHFAHPFRMFTL